MTHRSHFSTKKKGSLFVVEVGMKLDLIKEKEELKEKHV